MSISEADAQRIAENIIGRPSDDASHPWDLIEFPEGWLIDESSTVGASTEKQLPARLGKVNRAIERDSGKVLRFPSSVPPMKICRDYLNVRPRGYPEEMP